jgi:SnoaL-like domain
MTTEEVGNKLVELCRQDKNLEAIDTLFSRDAVSVEAMGSEAMPAVQTGIEAIRGKNEWWVANNEVHGGSVTGPFPNGDRFAVIFELDFTPKAGPRTGQRTRMEEVALYSVENGKIVREEFFYKLD